MRKLGEESDVVQLAAGLRVDWRQNAVESIIGLCRAKISKWLEECPKVRSIKALEELVCRKLKLVFEMVWSDEDLERIIRKYVGLGEPIFATLKAGLNEKTFASLVERRKITGASTDRYVAVVDCRGDKATRRFFTRWHEIAHLLTLQGQLELPLNRSAKNPTERLMDLIAGEIGFYAPIFEPILTEELAREEWLTFDVVERVRERFCPEASFQSTLNACVNRLGSGALVLEAGLGFKKSEQKQLNALQRELIPASRPQPKLRVLNVAGNKWAAGDGLHVHANMQVPSGSLIHSLYSAEHQTLNREVKGVEWLGLWRHSDGMSVSNIQVRIHARRLPKSVLALLLPTN